MIGQSSKSPHFSSFSSRSIPSSLRGARTASSPLGQPNNCTMVEPIHYVHACKDAVMSKDPMCHGRPVFVCHRLVSQLPPPCAVETHVPVYQSLRSPRCIVPALPSRRDERDRSPHGSAMHIWGNTKLGFGRSPPTHR